MERTTVTFVSHRKGAQAKNILETGKPGYPAKGFTPQPGETWKVYTELHKHGKVYWLHPISQIFADSPADEKQAQ
ncbi:MAG: hypothetical protein GC193_05305 [Cryomorphaceae bacterium]|nr:hypothetical protein [Cryomorphaceae bacterium]